MKVATRRLAAADRAPSARRVVAGVHVAVLPAYQDERLVDGVDARGRVGRPVAHRRLVDVHLRRAQVVTVDDAGVCGTDCDEEVAQAHHAVGVVRAEVGQRYAGPVVVVAAVEVIQQVAVAQVILRHRHDHAILLVVAAVGAARGLAHVHV